MARMEVWTYRRVPTGIDLKEFDVEAADGSIGKVDAATERAGESYIVVDTGPWILGKKVLLPAGVVHSVDARNEKVFVDRSREEIKNAPEYDEEAGANDVYRQRVGSYYSARAVGESRPETRSTPRAQSRRTSSPTRSQRSSRPARGRRRARTTDEPTRDELYEQAKRLGIEGRSKMNKAQLKRAVGRRAGRSGSTSRGRSTRSGSKANPVEVQAFLDGVSYPTRKGDLLREAERRGASRTIRSTLERLPEERFEDPTDVSEAIGRLR